MEERFDTQAMLVRLGWLAREIRKSDAYPALIGGVAGGIAGALMAALIAGRATSRGESLPAAKESRGWSPREILQLLTVGVGLAKQMQAWYKEREKS